jgi:basic membrane protein A
MAKLRKVAGLPMLAAVVLLSFALVLSACGDDDDNGGGGGGGGDASGPPQGKDVEKMAAFGIAAPETNRWDAGGKEAFEQAAKTVGAQPTWLSNIAFDQAPQVLDRLVRGDNDVMISNGAGFADGILDAAAKYPDRWFWVYSALADTKGLPNVVGIDFLWNELGYLAGSIACDSSKSKQIGVVLAQPIPAYTHALGGVTDGVKASCGSEKSLKATWTGTFDDNAKAKQATEALIAQGADVILEFQDAAVPGVHSAIKEHPDVKYVGTFFDWADELPDQIVTSVAIDYQDGYGRAAEMLRDGTLEPKIYQTGVKSGGIVLTDFHNASGKVEKDGKQLFEDIKSGKVKVDLSHEVSE